MQGGRIKRCLRFETSVNAWHHTAALPFGLNGDFYELKTWITTNVLLLKTQDKQRSHRRELGNKE